MIDLRQRSYQKELMDRDDISFADMEQVLKELNFINTWLGGHSITIEGVKQFNIKNRFTICEIGCGGGDNLYAIYKWCKKRNMEVDFIGIDMNAECIAFAKQQYSQLPCQWICSDYQKVQFNDNKPEIIFSSLFCHHFTDEEMISMLQWLRSNSTNGFFINDLQRHWLAYYLIKNLTRWFSRSYLVKNDACLSVARSFRRSDWQRLFAGAGIDHYNVQWKWAFRWLVVCK